MCSINESFYCITINESFYCISINESFYCITINESFYCITALLDTGIVGIPGMSMSKIVLQIRTFHGTRGCRVSYFQTQSYLEVYIFVCYVSAMESVNIMCWFDTNMLKYVAVTEPVIFIHLISDFSLCKIRLSHRIISLFGTVLYHWFIMGTLPLVHHWYSTIGSWLTLHYLPRKHLFKIL